MTQQFGSRRAAVVAQTLSELAAAPRLGDLQQFPHLNLRWSPRRREVVVGSSQQLTIRLIAVGDNERGAEVDTWRSWTAVIVRDVSFVEI